MVLIFESLTIGDVLFQLLPTLFQRKLNKADSIRALFWIDTPEIVRRLVVPLCAQFGVPAEKLHFQLVQVRNQHGELIRLQIPRNDLYSFWSLIDSNNGLSLRHPTNCEAPRFQFYVRKELLDGYITTRDSVFRALNLINVAAQSEVVPGGATRELVLRESPWKTEYIQYATG